MKQTKQQHDAKKLIKKFTQQKIFVAIKKGTVYQEYKTHMSLQSAKQCALKCVDERIDEAKVNTAAMNYGGVFLAARKIYLWNVKQEINKFKSF